MSGDLRTLTSPVSSPATRQKHLGAFYTPPEMADFMARWAVRGPLDRVLDSSFGGMVFLRAALKQLDMNGALNADRQLYGVDIDEEAIASAWSDGLGEATLVEGDFLKLSPGDEIPRVEAAIGNPPYVRYQLYDGRRGMAIAERHGVKLSRLASSWAPMIIHACDFVTDGGRIAQVLPAEVLHAQYASDVLRFICDEFARVRVVLFDDHVFPGAQEEVVLLLAEGKGQAQCESVEVLSTKNVTTLTEAADRPRQVDASADHKLLAGLIPEESIAIYDRLRSSELTRMLGDLARVDIGSVTGANSFFVRPVAEVDHLDPGLVRRAVSKAFHVPGARLGEDDFSSMDERGVPSRILVLDGDSASHSDDVDLLVKEGESLGLHERYKCRIRSPWYALPASQVSDPPALFLTYMSSEYPRLVSNDAGALSTNSVHGVRLHNGTNPRGLAASFYTSLTFLSAELVGRSYGGGVLKLEPSEAERLVVARPSKTHAALIDDVDRLLRARRHDELQTLVDNAVLVEDLGMKPIEVKALRESADRLRARRKSRSRRSSS